MREHRIGTDSKWISEPRLGEVSRRDDNAVHGGHRERGGHESRPV